MTVAGNTTLYGFYTLGALVSNGTNFGQVAATATATAKSTLHRQFQASLRFTF